MTTDLSDSRPELRVVCGAILREDMVLAALRGPGRALAGLWELPGGKVEPGEDDATALARELHEELGVRVRVGQAFATSHWAGGARPIVLVAHACTLVSGVPHATEHRELRWVGPNDLKGMNWAPADIALLGALGELMCK